MADQSSARAYGQAVLDAVSAFPEDHRSLLNLAVERTMAVGAVRVPVRTHDCGIDVDLSDALGGALVLVRTLVTMVREASGQDADVIIGQARTRFDADCYG